MGCGPHTQNTSESLPSLKAPSLKILHSVKPLHLNSIILFYVIFTAVLTHRNTYVYIEGNIPEIDL